MKHIGFTGTQHGMTDKQSESLLTLLTHLESAGYQGFHHGDCIGADAEAHDFAVDMQLIVYVHPPDNPSKRAFKAGIWTAKPKPYLKRNHDIVDACDVLIATPRTVYEELRSGTWATIRYARKQGKALHILAP